MICTPAVYTSYIYCTLLYNTMYIDTCTPCPSCAGGEIAACTYGVASAHAVNLCRWNTQGIKSYKTST